MLNEPTFRRNLPIAPRFRSTRPIAGRGEGFFEEQRQARPTDLYSSPSIPRRVAVRAAPITVPTIGRSRAVMPTGLGGLPISSRDRHSLGPFQRRVDTRPALFPHAGVTSVRASRPRPCRTNEVLSGRARVVPFTPESRPRFARIRPQPEIAADACRSDLGDVVPRSAMTIRLARRLTQYAAPSDDGLSVPGRRRSGPADADRLKNAAPALQPVFVTAFCSSNEAESERLPRRPGKFFAGVFTPWR